MAEQPEDKYLKIGQSFVDSFSSISQVAYETAMKNGWFDHGINMGEQISLIHAELSEALEALRNNNPPDEHIKDFKSAEVELADVIIRIMSLSVAKKYRIGPAVVSKIGYNKNRPWKHGGKLF